MPNNPVLSHHISSQFNEEMQQVNTKFMTMGGLVEQQVANGIRALLDTDSVDAGGDSKPLRPTSSMNLPVLALLFRFRHFLEL